MRNEKEIYEKLDLISNRIHELKSLLDTNRITKEEYEEKINPLQAECKILRWVLNEAN